MALPEDYDGPTFGWEGERYPFDPSKLLGSEVKLLKSRTGLSYMAYMEGMQELDAEAVGYYIWLKIGQPGKFSEFDYDYSAFLESLDGFVEEPADPTPPPNRAARRKTSKRSSAGGGHSSATTAAASPPTGS